jgi:hypothetical protein
MAYNSYTTRQVIALVKEYDQFISDYWNKNLKNLNISFEHWLIKREEEKKAKPDCRHDGNAGRKKMNKLDRVKSIDKIYFNIKGEAITINEYLPSISRFRCTKRRTYSPTGQAYYMGARLPKDNDLIITE